MSTGAQLPNTLVVKTNTDEFLLHGRPCELSAHAFVPPGRNVAKERSYFNTDKKERYGSSVYDRLYNQETGYNQYLHRCDRDHAKSRGLTVNEEEKIKGQPTLGSSEYGHRLSAHVDHSDRKHVRIATVRSEFYRRNNINVKYNDTH